MKVEWSRDWQLTNYGYGLGKPYLVVMKPEEFLKFSHTLHPGMKSEMSIKTIKQGIKDENIFDVPYIYRGPRGVATGEHEGRHRAHALIEMGIDAMPVLIYDETQKGEELNEWKGRERIIEAYKEFHP